MFIGVLICLWVFVGAYGCLWVFKPNPFFYTPQPCFYVYLFQNYFTHRILAIFQFQGLLGDGDSARFHRQNSASSTQNVTSVGTPRDSIIEQLRYENDRLKIALAQRCV